MYTTYSIGTPEIKLRKIGRWETGTTENWSWKLGLTTELHMVVAAKSEKRCAMGGRSYCRQTQSIDLVDTGQLIACVFEVMNQCLKERLNSRTQNRILQWVQSDHLPPLRSVEGLIHLSPPLLHNHRYPQWEHQTSNRYIMWTFLFFV